MKTATRPLGDADEKDADGQERGREGAANTPAAPTARGETKATTEAETEGETAAARLWREAASERSAGRLHDALFLFEQAAPHFERGAGGAAAGDFDAEFAGLLARLGEDERRDDYLERARAVYASAESRFERHGDDAGRARAAHALARLSLALGRHAEAHQHLDRAHALTGRHAGPQTPEAQPHPEETRARVLLAEGHFAAAEASARAAVRALGARGPSAHLASALTAHGVALARMAQTDEAREALRRAALEARRAGDASAEGRAALALVEELSDELPFAEVAEEFDRAVALLAPPRSLPLTERLCAAARRVVGLAAAHEPARHTWQSFSLREAVHRFEAGVIGRALADAGGSVSRAAQLLGFRHHNSLASILNHRHRDLLAERSPVKPRRRSIITVRGPVRAPRFAGVGQTSIVLHVEDDLTVADAVRVALEAEGCRVEMCADGLEALARLRGTAPYDLLLLDQELPGAGAAEITRAARALAHRRATPVIVFSAADAEREALDAGADLFLRKPQDSPALTDAVKRLIRAAKKAGGADGGDRG